MEPGFCNLSVRSKEGEVIQGQILSGIKGSACTGKFATSQKTKEGQGAGSFHEIVSKGVGEMPIPQTKQGRE